MRLFSLSFVLILILLSQNISAQEGESNSSNATADITVLFPEAPAKSYVTVLCSACHDLSRVLVQQKDYALWENTLLRMVGGMVDNEQLDLIVEYLAEHFGPENLITEFPLDINTLSKTVLLRLPGIDNINADEVLDYIKLNGSLSSLDEIRHLIESEDDWNALSGLIITK